MLHHRTNTTITPSHFTGKEKDPLRLYLQSGELCRARLTSPPDLLTGYSYFGARYLEHNLITGWLSVDPMCDKYPSLSPYAYCEWNPVKLVDPDGNDYVNYISFYIKDKDTSIKGMSFNRFKKIIKKIHGI